MRSLTVVKDLHGDVKIAQFGSVWDGDDPKAFQKACNFFREFVSQEENIKLLIKQTEKVKFFTDEEYKIHCKQLFERNVKATHYEEKYLSEDIGVYILSKVGSFTKDTRLVSDYKYVKDVLFAPVIFEIDLSTGIASIKERSATVFSMQVKEAEKEAGKKTEEPIAKKRRGRPPRSEAEKYHASLLKKQEKEKAKSRQQKRQGKRITKKRVVK